MADSAVSVDAVSTPMDTGGDPLELKRSPAQGSAVLEKLRKKPCGPCSGKDVVSVKQPSRKRAASVDELEDSEPLEEDRWDQDGLEADTELEQELGELRNMCSQNAIALSEVRAELHGINTSFRDLRILIASMQQNPSSMLKTSLPAVPISTKSSSPTSQTNGHPLSLQAPEPIVQPSLSTASSNLTSCQPVLRQSTMNTLWEPPGSKMQPLSQLSKQRLQTLGLSHLIQDLQASRITPVPASSKITNSGTKAMEME